MTVLFAGPDRLHSSTSVWTSPEDLASDAGAICESITPFVSALVVHTTAGAFLLRLLFGVRPEDNSRFRTEGDGGIGSICGERNDPGDFKLPERVRPRSLSDGLRKSKWKPLLGELGTDSTSWSALPVHWRPGAGDKELVDCIRLGQGVGLVKDEDDAVEVLEEVGDRAGRLASSGTEASSSTGIAGDDGVRLRYGIPCHNPTSSIC